MTYPTLSAKVTPAKVTLAGEFLDLKLTSQAWQS